MIRITSPCSATRPPNAFCIDAPDATFMAKSSVIMPLPLSPAAANTAGTPSGMVSPTKKCCSGGDPTKYLSTNRLSSSREIGFLTLLFCDLMNLSMSKPSSIASAASHFSSFVAGICRVNVLFAPASLACASTIRANFLPASSLSGHKTNSLLRSCVKSNLLAVFSDSIPAPPMVQVAVYPSCVRASAHFSPSTQITVFALKTFGILYNGLGSGMPWRPSMN